MKKKQMMLQSYTFIYDWQLFLELSKDKANEWQKLFSITCYSDSLGRKLSTKLAFRIASTPTAEATSHFDHSETIITGSSLGLTYHAGFSFTFFDRLRYHRSNLLFLNNEERGIGCVDEYRAGFECLQYGRRRRALIT